jgi:hypothetical protein
LAGRAEQGVRLSGSFRDGATGWACATGSAGVPPGKK